MEECGSNYQVRWLCGMDPICHPPTNRSLEKAIENVERYYTFVGILELGSLNLQLLSKLLPTFFSPRKVCVRLAIYLPVVADDTVLRKCVLLLQKMMPVEKKMSPVHGGVNTKYISEASRAKLKRINHLDFAIYEYALKRLIDQAQSCSLVDQSLLKPALDLLQEFKSER